MLNSYSPDEYVGLIKDANNLINRVNTIVSGIDEDGIKHPIFFIEERQSETQELKTSVELKAEEIIRKANALKNNSIKSTKRKELYIAKAAELEKCAEQLREIGLDK